MNTIIYDPAVSGHHLDYLTFLVDFLLIQPQSVQEKYIFVVNPDAKSRFSSAESKLKFHYLDPSIIAHFDSIKSILVKAKTEFDVIEALSETYHASNIILMFVDYMQLEIGKRQSNKLKLSGIFFSPFRPQFEDQNTIKNKLNGILKGIRKDLQVRWMLRNKNLNRLFILNDRSAVAEFNHKYGNRFSFLPDPAPNFNTTAQLESMVFLRKKYKIDSSKKVLLIFGSISRKKNIENIIEALKLLSPAYQQQIVLYICGEPDEEYSMKLSQLLTKSAISLPNITFIPHLSFVPSAIIDDIFRLSSLILSPYINYYNSSGVVSLAAKYNVPILVAESSLAADIVSEYKLGFAVNPKKSADIAAILSFFLCDGKLIDGSKYLIDFSADKFCEEILAISK